MTPATTASPIPTAAGAAALDDGYMKLIAPGDILTWRSFVGGGTHIAIVSQTAGWPRLIQNYGWGVHEEVLNPAWMTGVGAAFRWRPLAARAARTATIHG